MQRILVGEIYSTAIRKVGNRIFEIVLTADKLHRNMTCSSSGDDLLGPIWISGILPFGGLMPSSSEY